VGATSAYSLSDTSAEQLVRARQNTIAMTGACIRVLVESLVVRLDQAWVEWFKSMRVYGVLWESVCGFCVGVCSIVREIHRYILTTIVNRTRQIHETCYDSQTLIYNSPR